MTILDLTAEIEALVDALASFMVDDVIARFTAYIDDADFCDDEPKAYALLLVGRLALQNYAADDDVIDAVAAILLDNFDI